MNKPLIIILILLFIGLLLFGAWYISKTFCGVVPAAAPVAASNSCGTWAFDDGETFRAESNRYYRFKRNETKSIASNREDFQNAISSTVNYLKKNKDRMLKITGLYESVEQNNGSNTNIGIARANDIKARLTKMGVSTDQLQVDSEILREDVVHSDTLCRGAFFTFYPKGSGMSNVKARSATSYLAGAATAVTAGKKLIGKDMTIYFRTNKDELRLSSREKQDMKDIKAFMDATPTARLNVSGHTDSRGDDAYNKKLSQGRADFAAKELSRRYGIPMSKINVVGYGEERPVDRGNNEEAWKKNRRVEVRLTEK